MQGKISGIMKSEVRLMKEERLARKGRKKNYHVGRWRITKESWIKRGKMKMIMQTIGDSNNTIRETR